MTSKDPQIRQMLHDIGNALNTMALKLEVAHMHLEQEQSAMAIDEIEQLLAKCKEAAALIHREQQDLGTRSGATK